MLVLIVLVQLMQACFLLCGFVAHSFQFERPLAEGKHRRFRFSCEQARVDNVSILHLPKDSDGGSWPNLMGVHSAFV